MRSGLHLLSMSLLLIKATAVQAAPNPTLIETKAIQAGGGVETIAPTCALLAEILRQENTFFGRTENATEFSEFVGAFDELFQRTTGHGLHMALGASLSQIANDELDYLKGQSQPTSFGELENWNSCLEFASKHSETADLVK
mgnify:FL=1